MSRAREPDALARRRKTKEYSTEPLIEDARAERPTPFFSSSARISCSMAWSARSAVAPRAAGPTARSRTSAPNCLCARFATALAQCDRILIYGLEVTAQVRRTGAGGPLRRHRSGTSNSAELIKNLLSSRIDALTASSTSATAAGCRSPGTTLEDMAAAPKAVQSSREAGRCVRAMDDAPSTLASPSRSSFPLRGADHVRRSSPHVMPLHDADGRLVGTVQ